MSLILGHHCIWVCRLFRTTSTVTRRIFSRMGLCCMRCCTKCHRGSAMTNLSWGKRSGPSLSGLKRDWAINWRTWLRDVSRSTHRIELTYNQCLNINFSKLVTMTPFRTNCNRGKSERKRPLFRPESRVINNWFEMTYLF